jgi:hypothetical protein
MIGQSESKETCAQALHGSRHQVAQTAFEGKNACCQNRKAYEEVRGLSETESFDARNWSGPSAIVLSIDMMWFGSSTGQFDQLI